MPEPVAAPLIGGVALLERSVGYALGELGGLAPAELARPTPCAGWDLGDLLRHLTDSVSVMHEAGSAGRVELTAGELHPGPDPASAGLGSASAAGDASAGLGSASAAGDASAGLGSASAAGDASAGLGSASAAGSASAGLVPASAAGSASAGPDPVGRLRDRIRSLLGLWSDAAWAGCTGPGAVVAVGGRPLSGGIVAAVGALEIAVHGWDVSRARGRRAPVPAPLAEELLELAPVLVIPRYRPGRFAAAVPVPPGSPPGDRLVAFLGRQPD